ncbi:MAG: family 16 glycoside hydrolase [Candidatus Hinthialibacter sp.]
MKRFGLIHGTAWTALLIGLTAFALPAAAQYPDSSGYTPIFNGRDISGWTMQWSGLWTVEKGILTGKQDPATGQDSWLFTNEEWDDFSLYLEFKMTPNCNSGVGIRMPKGVEGRPSQHGYEIQISDIDEKFPTGSVFRHSSANQNLHKKGWNEMYIVCVKDHIVVYVNRQKVTDVHLEGSKKGRIGLQVHGGEELKDQVVEFRNIKIKDLKPQYKAAQSSIQFKIHQLGADLSEGASIADFNRDGQLDITCGSYWYEAPDWRRHQLRVCEVSGEYQNDYGEWAMDVNRDGWPDVITGGWFSPILAWYENPGPPQGDQMWERHIIADDLPATEAILQCDVDNDGRKDILVNRYDESALPTYFAYVGLDKSESGFERRVLGIEGRGHGMGCGDVNADGLNDVLTPSGWYECPLHPQTQEWIWHGNYHAHHTSIPFPVEDLNLDGLPDVIYGFAHNFGLHWLEQTRDSAGRQAWITQTIDPTYSQIHCPLLVDLDGDGTRDLIAGKRYRGHNGGDPGAMEPLCIFWYKIVKGPDPQFIKQIITYDENIGVGMNTQAVDIDYDGDLDLVAPGKTGLYLIENLTK